MAWTHRRPLGKGGGPAPGVLGRLRLVMCVALRVCASCVHVGIAVADGIPRLSTSWGGGPRIPAVISGNKLPVHVRWEFPCREVAWSPRWSHIVSRARFVRRIVIVVLRWPRGMTPASLDAAALAAPITLRDRL